MSTCSVELRSVSKMYPGVHALKDVDFKLMPGDIHCLVGQNGSGKSTLIKILSGVEAPEDGGEIYIEGERQFSHNCESALHAGIQVIYQDISLFPNLTVAENIAFRHYTNEAGIVAHKNKVKEIAHQAIDMIGVNIDIDSKLGDLSIAQQQLVEIARSLTGKLKLLILDEPTASLTRKEVNALFTTIKKIKAQGIAVLFVSHKLNEIFEIAEGVSILRDGAVVGRYSPKELDREKLTLLMTGQKEIHVHPNPLDSDAPVLLEVKNLSKKHNYKDISFQIRKGEILGITGLLGSGRTELALSLFGMNTPDKGDIFLEGTRVSIHTHVEAKAKGIAYVSENRRDLGLVQEQSIESNIIITTLQKFLNKFKFIDLEQVDAHTQKYIQDIHIKVSNKNLKIKTLSGGNQQKVVLSKWLATHPKLLILDEPTIGIDVIAKSNIHHLMKQMAEQGMSILMISDEVNEVLNNCHRVLIMDKGKIIHEFLPQEEDEEDLLAQFNLA